jgi:predicted deacylase
VTNVVKHLGAIEGTPEAVEQPVHIPQSASMTAEQGEIFYPAVSIGQKVEKGQVEGDPILSVGGSRIGAVSRGLGVLHRARASVLQVGLSMREVEDGIRADTPSRRVPLVDGGDVKRD